MGERNKRVFALLESQGKTKAAMARALSISKSAVTQWEKNGTDPSYDQCELLAPFFNVSVDYLWDGSTSKWQPTISAKEEKDIEKRASGFIESIGNDTGLMFNGQPIDDETRALFQNALEVAMKTASLAAKEKFTPNKYKK